jgi:hypothetical protein
MQSLLAGFSAGLSSDSFISFELSMIYPLRQLTPHPTRGWLPTVPLRKRHVWRLADFTNSLDAVNRLPHFDLGLVEQ